MMFEFYRNVWVEEGYILYSKAKKKSFDSFQPL